MRPAFTLSPVSFPEEFVHTLNCVPFLQKSLYNIFRTLQNINLFFSFFPPLLYIYILNLEELGLFYATLELELRGNLNTLGPQNLFETIFWHFGTENIFGPLKTENIPRSQDLQYFGAGFVQ